MRVRKPVHACGPVRLQHSSLLLPTCTSVAARPLRPATASYNAVNGVPSCANNWLLGTLLRDAWGFDGTVVSDCDADSDV